MIRINRDPAEAQKKRYDIIVVGGGIYGLMISLEAARRGVHCLLLEQHDFGSQTSFNNLRIIHGGLRYLQNLDFHRFRESVRERHWFLKHFPGRVQLLPCIMPLYGDGLRRPNILRLALLLNDLLTRRRNQGVRASHHMPSGRVLSKKETVKCFPAVIKHGLRGAALWYDAFVPDMQCLFFDILLTCVGLGVTAINYFKVEGLDIKEGKVKGVLGIDKESGKQCGFQANTVVNAAGPWSRELARQFNGSDLPSLFTPSLAFNVLLDRPPLFDSAVAVAPPRKGANTYFLVPWGRRIFAGTGHYPWLRGPITTPLPKRSELHAFMSDLNEAIPNLNVSEKDIVRIFSGLLPVVQPGSVDLTHREVIYDHGKQGGLKGLYSISGIKYTTARLVAEKLVLRLLADVGGKGLEAAHPWDSVFSGDGFSACVESNDAVPSDHAHLRTIVDQQAAAHLDDLVFRRTNLWKQPDAALSAAKSLSELFNWPNDQLKNELTRLEKAFFCASPARVSDD